MAKEADNQLSLVFPKDLYFSSDIPSAPVIGSTISVRNEFTDGQIIVEAKQMSRAKSLIMKGCEHVIDLSLRGALRITRMSEAHRFYINLTRLALWYQPSIPTDFWDNVRSTRVLQREKQLYGPHRWGRI